MEERKPPSPNHSTELMHAPCSTLNRSVPDPSANLPNNSTSKSGIGLGWDSYYSTSPSPVYFLFFNLFQQIFTFIPLDLFVRQFLRSRLSKSFCRRVLRIIRVSVETSVGACSFNIARSTGAHVFGTYYLYVLASALICGHYLR